MSERVEEPEPVEETKKEEQKEEREERAPEPAVEPVFNLALRYPEEFEPEPDMFEAMVDFYAAHRGLEGDRKRAAVKLARAIAKIGGPGDFARKFGPYFQMVRSYLNMFPETESTQMIKDAIMGRTMLEGVEALKASLSSEDWRAIRSMVIPIMVLRELLRMDQPQMPTNNNNPELQALKEEIKALRRMFEEHLKAEEEKKRQEEIKAIEDRLTKRIDQLEQLITNLANPPQGQGRPSIAERWFNLIEGLIEAQKEEIKALRERLSERDKEVVDRLLDRVEKLEDFIRDKLTPTGPTSPEDAVEKTVKILKSTKELIDTARSLPQTPESEKVAKYKLAESIVEAASEVAMEAVKAFGESSSSSSSSSPLSDTETKVYEYVGEMLSKGERKLSVKKIAEGTGLSEREVRRALKSLVDKGLLTIKKPSG